MTRRMVRLVLAAMLTLLFSAGCSSRTPAATTTTPTTTPTTAPVSAPVAAVPTFCADAAAGSALAAANYLAQHKQSTAAVDLYTKLLASQTISSRERDCAVQGLAAVTLAAPPAAQDNPVQSTSHDWDTFYAGWVAPGARVLGPFAVTLVLILLLARVFTRIVVRSATPGPTRNSLPTRAVFFWSYWLLGIGSIFYASWLAGAGVAHAAFWAHPPPALTDRSIAAYVAGLFVLGLLTLGCDWRRNTREAVLDIVTGLAVVTVTLLATGVPLVSKPPSSAQQWVPTMAHALGFALVGCWIVARIRGVQIGTVIVGAGKDGGANNGVGQLIRSRLSGLASGGPTGVLVPQQTDVSTLEKDAIALLPDGALAKAATLLLQLFLPATPWLLTISEIDDLALEVSMTRNGHVVASQLILPATVGFPAKAESASGGAAPAADDGAGLADLYTAAASFVLIELSTRYRYLRPGLNGATSWRSVAAQVIATTAVPAKSHDLKVRLLTRAVAADGHNAAARLAYLFELHGRDSAGNEAFVNGLEALRTQLHDEVDRAAAGRPRSAILLRLYFNLVVGWANAAAAPGDGQVSGLDRDQAWDVAVAYSAILTQWLQTIESPGLRRGLFRIRELQQLGRDIGDVLTPVNAYLSASHDVSRAHHAGSPGSVAHHLSLKWNGKPFEIVAAGEHVPRPVPESPPTGLTAYYERACALAALRTDKDAVSALAYLKMAATTESNRVWARRDPSFDWMRDPSPPPPLTSVAAQFRAIVCDPVPGFLDLEPLAGHKKELTAIGITTASELGRRSKRWLARQLSVSSGVSECWLDLADLAVMRASEKDPTMTIESAQWLFLLLKAGISSRSGLRGRITAPVEDSVNKLREDLAETALDYDVVAPTAAQVRSWAAFARPASWWW